MTITFTMFASMLIFRLPWNNNRLKIYFGMKRIWKELGRKILRRPRDNREYGTSGGRGKEKSGRKWKSTNKFNNKSTNKFNNKFSLAYHYPKSNGFFIGTKTTKYSTGLKVIVNFFSGCRNVGHHMMAKKKIKESFFSKEN